MTIKEKQSFLKRLVKKIPLFQHSQIATGIQESIPFWIAAAIAGLVAVGYTVLFNYAEALLHYALRWNKWILFVLSPLSMLIAWGLVRKWAPSAGGSGIPQVMAAIELSSPNYKKTVGKLLSIKIAIVKIISSCFMVLGGAAIGREGPTIQISASIFQLTHRVLPSRWPKLSQKSFLLTGSAAGLAAAFNTPLGGVVFAIEELARVHVSHFRTALFISVIISGLAAQALIGSYLFLGYPDVKNLHAYIFFGVAITAVVAGFLGALMSKIIFKIISWKASFHTWQSIVFIIAVGLTLAAIAIFANDHILGSGKEELNQLLFTSDKKGNWDLAILRILGPILSFSTGGAGGVFAPSLAAGASVGGFVSGLIGFAGANANLLILGGMVGFLTGVTRTPFTSAILVLEMTDRHSVIFYLMLAAVFAHLAALLIEKHSLYDALRRNYVQQAKGNSARQRTA